MMNVLSRVFHSILISTVLLGAISFVRSADSSVTDTQYSEQVTVTASRTEQSVDQSGNAVTIIDRETIERMNVVYLSELLRTVAGISISQAGGDGAFTQMRVRGAEANHVLVMIDGVPASDTFAGDGLPLELVTTDSIERIEIVRGPSSGVWGADAVAGVVNIQTRAVSQGLALSLEAGSSSSVRGSVGFGLKREHHSFGVQANGFESDGTNVSRVGSEKDGTEHGNIGVKYQWSPESSPLYLGVNANHTTSESEFDSVDFVTTGLPADSDHYTDTVWSNLNFQGGYQREETRWNHQFTGSLGRSDTETFASSVSNGQTELRRLSLGWQSALAVSVGPLQQTVFAVEHEVRDFSQRGTATPFGDPNQDQTMDNSAATVELQWGAGDQWSLVTNLRFDSYDAFDDVFSYRASGNFKLGSSAFSLRTHVGSGHKVPTFIERFGFFPDSFIGNPDLKPESVIGYELGLDYQWNQRTRTAVTWFESQLEDEINGFFFDVSQGLFTAVNENGKSDRSGVEVEWDYQAKAFGFGVNYTYLDATEPDMAMGEREELRRPSHTGSLYWQQSLNKVPLRYRIDLNYSGSQLDMFFPPFPAPAETVTLDSYWLLGMSADYQLVDVLALTFRVDNAFDEEYEEIYGFNTPGSRVFIGVRYKGNRK